jgi:hypothetical protein
MERARPTPSAYPPVCVWAADALGKLFTMPGSIESRLPQRSILAIDLLVVLWTVAWLVLGVAVGTFIERLGAVGEGLEDSGRAIVRAGDAVGDLSDVPLVGEGFAAVADEIRSIGRETAENGRSVEDDVNSLALLVGVGLALGPTLPVLFLWLPPRVSRERERNALRKSLKSGDRAALAYLANRAVATRLFRELRRASDDPVADLAAGRFEALAELELDHLALGSIRWTDGGRPAPVGKPSSVGR